MNRYLLGFSALLPILVFLFFSPASASEWIVQFVFPAVAQSQDAVNQVLRNMDGISEAEFSTRDVTITFDSDDTDVEEIQKKLAGAGFPVKKTVIVKEG